MAAVLLCVTLCVLLLSGCDVLKGLGFIPEDESGGTQEEPGWSGVPVEEELNNPSIKVKFGVDVAGPKAVDAAFHELSAFIKKRGLSDQPDVIKLGDWIDLEGGLSVAVDEDGDYTGGFNATNIDVNPEPLPFENYEGKLLRLIVVGINSFHSGKGVERGYTISANDSTQHVVFQFQNIPVLRRMNVTQTNEGGYAESEMRQYLVPVEGEGGNFLTGLQEAGVPKDVLWAPTRYVSHGDDSHAIYADEIADLLWLPTEREMFGEALLYASNPLSNATYETVLNQAWLEYYSDTYYGLHKKYDSFSQMQWYCESSPYHGDSTYWCTVGTSASLDYVPDYNNNEWGGVAPAFCVR